MKINIDKVRVTPSNMEFSFCVYGEPTEEVAAWAAHWGFKPEKSGPFTNLLVPIGYDITQCFETPEPYAYLDGFSPNLNKHLHLGHFCNMVLAKAMFSLGVGEKTLAILGDTLGGDIGADEAMKAFESHCDNFDYTVDRTVLASEAKLSEEQEAEMLIPGEGEYEGTMCFDNGEQKQVGLRSDGSTTYIYQDIALAYLVQKPYLIITGNEQREHFEFVNKLCPWVDHVNMGLVKNDGIKMSSRLGNVIMMQEIIDELQEKFNDIKLVYNIIAGKLLNYSPTSEKNIIREQLMDPKHSPGLYLSYAMARLISAGCSLEITHGLQSASLQYALVKSKCKLDPSVLLKALMDHAKSIHSLYEQHPIKGDENNKIFFNGLLSDLSFGMTELGMFLVTHVPQNKEENGDKSA